MEAVHKTAPTQLEVTRVHAAVATYRTLMAEAVLVRLNIGILDLDQHIMIAFFVDINECAVNNGNCSQMCINTIGSYRCSCVTGYLLNPDGRTCLGEG